MQRIDQNLSLSVSAVRQLDLRLDLSRIGILRLSHPDLKGQYFLKSQPVQRICKLLRPNLQRRLCKIDIIRIDQCILQNDRFICMKRRYMIIAPGAVLLPA